MTPEPLSASEQLRAARERRGLELPAIARSLRIPIKTLEALEAGTLTSLPAAVYTRGFLRQYAEFLGLDPVPFLRAHDADRARLPRVAVPPPWTESERRRPRLFSLLAPRPATLIAGSLGLAAVALYVLLHVRTYVRAPILNVLEPPQNTEVPGFVLAVRGRTDATAELSINGERTLVREDGTFEESIGLSSGVNVLRFQATSIGGRESVVTREVLVRSAAGSESPPVSPVPGVETPAPGSGPFTLTLRADQESVWVSIAVEEKTAFAGLLLPGSEHSVSGQRITVTSGKAARTLVRLDGSERGSLGDTPGVLRNVTFTRNPGTGTVEQTHAPEVPPERTPESGSARR